MPARENPCEVPSPAYRSSLARQTQPQDPTLAPDVQLLLLVQSYPNPSALLPPRTLSCTTAPIWPRPTFSQLPPAAGTHIWASSAGLGDAQGAVTPRCVRGEENKRSCGHVAGEGLTGSPAFHPSTSQYPAGPGLAPVSQGWEVSDSLSDGARILTVAASRKRLSIGLSSSCGDSLPARRSYSLQSGPWEGKPKGCLLLLGSFMV